MWNAAKDHSPKPMTVLAALFRCPEEVEKMDIRLKVSREEKTLALFLVKYRQELCRSQDEPDSLKPFTDFIFDVSFCLVTLSVFFIFVCVFLKRRFRVSQNMMSVKRFITLDLT